MSTKDFAELLRQFGQAVAELTAATGRNWSNSYLQPYRDQARDTKNAVTTEYERAARVPSPPSEDPTIHDGYVQAALIGLLQRPTWNNDSLVAKAREIADSAMKAREVKA